jgi:5-methylcytosine-specific restriction endonuclease McrA
MAMTSAERQKRYRERHPEKTAAAQKVYRAANKDKFRALFKSWRSKNLASELKRCRKYKEENAESVAARQKLSNPRRAVTQNKRRARKKNTPGSHTLEEWEKLKADCGYTCLCCFKNEPEIQLTRDHIIPIGFPGASDGIENIQPLCRSCNSAKKNKALDFRYSV